MRTPVRGASGLASAAFALALLGGRAAAQSFTEFALPGPTASAPGDEFNAAFVPGIVSGPDGSLWFTEAGRHRVARFTLRGDLTEFAVSALHRPLAIANGPDGNVWFTEEGGFLGRITPEGTVTEIPIPAESLFPEPSGIAAGPDGNLWVMLPGFRCGPDANGGVARVTTSGVFSFYASAEALFGSIAVGPDGRLWFGGSACTYPVPTTGRLWRLSVAGEIAGPVAEGGPRLNALALGADGNLWLTPEFLGYENAIARVSPDGVVTRFPIPTIDAKPGAIIGGPDGNVWFTEWKAGKLARITPAGAISEWSLPTPGAGPSSLTFGADGAIWIVEQQAGKLARFTSPELPAPPATIPTLASSRLAALALLLAAAGVAALSAAPRS